MQLPFFDSDLYEAVIYMQFLGAPANIPAMSYYTAKTPSNAGALISDSQSLGLGAALVGNESGRLYEQQTIAFAVDGCSGGTVGYSMTVNNPSEAVRMLTTGVMLRLKEDN